MKNTFAILPDVTCDLPKSVRDQYGIDIIHGHYTTPDGVDHMSTLEWTDEERKAFYADLKKHPNSYTTAPPNTVECYNAFERYAKENVPVLALCISGGISGTVDFMTQAKNAILEKYKDAEIYIVDSRRFSVGFGLMALVASELREQGKSVKEVYDFLEENKNRIHQTGWMDDLSFVAKKGRISNAKAFFGMLVGVKPIGEFDYNGLTTVIGKVKGEKVAYDVLIEYMARHIENPEEQTILIATTDRHKQAYEYKAMIEKRFSPKAVYVFDVFQSCGINVGPGLMAAYYFGKPITEGLIEERQCLADILAGK